MSPKTREVVLALDQGSSSSRVVAYDLRGRPVVAAQRPVQTFRPRPGWAEHDPAELARALEAALDAVLAKLPRSVSVAAAGLAVQRSTTVFLDSRTMKPAGRAPSWMDSRAIPVVKSLDSKRELVHSRTGLYLNPYYSAPKIRWCLDHDKKLRALADAGRLLCAPVATFLAARLTRSQPMTDPTCAQRTLLMDLDREAWSPELLKAFGLEAEMLPAIASTSGPWGVIERKGRRIPLLAACGDQQAAAVGLGADEEGRTVANYGTGAFLLRHIGGKPRRVKGLLTSAAASGGYLLEGTVHAAGSSFEWLRDNFGVLKGVSEIDAAIRRSTRRIWALPAIGGLGAPRWDYGTQTAFFGLDAKTTGDDLVRGVAEALCFLVHDIAEVMRDADFPVESARVAGGLSRSNEMMAFQSDILGVPLERRKEVEATALGAAVLAARAAGLDAKAMTGGKPEKRFSPRIAADAQSRLATRWSLFVEGAQAMSRDLDGQLGEPA